MKKMLFVLCVTSFLAVNFFSSSIAMEKDTAIEEDKIIRILSIDGGRGVRGLLPARLLQHWEGELQKEFNRKVSIPECFDIVAGTSMGCIIPLGLNYKEDNLLLVLR